MVNPKPITVGRVTTNSDAKVDEFHHKILRKLSRNNLGIILTLRLQSWHTFALLLFQAFT